VVHHDGPFDAASSHRNRHVGSKNPSRQAPMAAFDPSALVLPTSTASQQTQESGSHTYPPPPAGGDHLMAVSMGYPAGMIAEDPKAARLAEAFGIQGREAWEDFASARAPEEFSRRVARPEIPTQERRFERDAKAASVWDMEETMRSGKPVPSSLPPLPSLPENFRPLHSPGNSLGTFESSPNGGGSNIKRSRSLMQRIKKGVRSPPPVPVTPGPEFSSPETIGAGREEEAEGNGMTRKPSLLGKFMLGRKQTYSHRNQLPTIPGA
ncbi:hypothetical protein CROQUDRAFT_50884, partial [Cronartium quercuum f. sp. fusiforme G11]